MGTGRDVEVVEAFFRAIADGDPKACFAVVHPEVRVREPEGLPYGGEYRGRDGLADLSRRVMARFDLVIHGWEVSGASPRVLAVVDVTFTCRATGRGLRTSVVEIYEVRDGMLLCGDIYPKDTRAIHELTLA